MLFRRRSRDRDASSDEPAEATPASTSPPSAEGPSAATSTPNPPAPVPGTVPPPLPQRPADAVPSGPPSGSFSRCFVCGSTLERGACPVCRIAWVE